MNELQKVRDGLLGRIRTVACKRRCILRAFRLNRLIKRLDAVERVLKG